MKTPNRLCALTLLFVGGTAHADLVVSREGRFTIEFPGKPTADVATVNTTHGTLPVHLLALDAGNDRFEVSYFDYPADDGIVVPEPSPPAVGPEVGGGNAPVVLHERSVRAGAVHGSEVVSRWVRRNLELVITTRSFTVERRVYHVSTMVEPRSPRKRTARLFADSFALLPRR